MLGVFVALYRGINVGGRRSVKMEDLRALHEGLRHSNVGNYVQSGNIVFSARGTAPAIAGMLAAAFAEEFDFESQVIVLGARKWTEIVAGNPYARIAARTPKAVHAGICAGVPDAGALTKLLKRAGGCEEFDVGGNVVYLHAPDGIGKSKFVSGMERAAGVPVTLRNWRTMEALRDLVVTRQTLRQK